MAETSLETISSNPNKKPNMKEVAGYMRIAEMSPDDVNKKIHEEMVTGGDNTELGKIFSDSILRKKPLDLVNAELGLGKRILDQISKLKKKDQGDIRKVADVLFNDLENFKPGGISDVFSLPKEASPEFGKNRKDNIDRMVSIKSALLNFAEGSFISGDIETSFGILNKYGVGESFNDNHNLPRTISEQSRFLSLDKPGEAVAIIKFAETLNKLPDVSSKLGPAFHDKVQKAQKMFLTAPQVSETPEAGPEMKTEEKSPEVVKDEEKPTDNPKKYFDLTTDDGKKILADFFNETYPSIRGFGEGIELNQKLIFEGLNQGGIFKYLDFLKKYIDDPQLLDGLALETSQKFNMSTDLLKEKLQVEVYGNVYGVLIGTIEYNGQNMNENDRKKIIEETIKILGQGHFYNGILMGDEQVSPAQMLVRTAIEEYRDKAGKESRIKRLDGIAALVDDDLIQETSNVEVEKKGIPANSIDTNPNIEKLSIDELKHKLEDSKDYLELINQIEDKIPDIVTELGRIRELHNDPNWQNFIIVEFIDKDPKKVDIKIDYTVLSKIITLIEEEKFELTQNPKDNETYKAMLRNEVDRSFLDGSLSVLVAKVNGDTYKTTIEEKGFMGIKRTVPVIYSDAFNEQPLPKKDDIIWPNSKLDIDDGLVDVKESKPDNIGKNWSLADLQREVTALNNESNISEVANRVIQVEKLLDERANLAKRFARGLEDRVKKSISNLAIDYVYNRLKNYLVEENRIVDKT